MNKSQKIQEIISLRQPLAEELATVEENLNHLQITWHKLEDYRNQLQFKTQDEKVLSKLQEINFSDSKTKILESLEKLSKLSSRFQRETLNIGVVGRARQGKSRLLQSITGLVSGEIPDGDRQHCTGVRSTIHHNSHVETYGEVWFYTERSFLHEIIYPYYTTLDLGQSPISTQDFANNPLPTLRLEGSENQAKYEHLKRYHIHFSEYSHLLKSSSPRNIRQEEIRQYVAQDDENGERIYFNYLAVKEVKIVCQFPNNEVGQIAVVDMPGLGDTGIGDEARMIQTLAEDVDFVLFVKMPKPSGDYWADVDVKLYDTVNASLVDLPVKLWSFMVLNQTDKDSKYGDNSANCQDLIESMTEKHIHVSDYIITNCANPEEVNEKILEKTLDYLSNNITQLDQKYVTAFYEQLVELQSTIKGELQKAKETLNRVDSFESESKFDDLFNEFWDNITNDLTDLLEVLREKRNDQDDYFKEQVEAVFQECQKDQSIFPSLEEIKRRRNTLGDYPRAYGYYIDEVRTGLSRRFLNLDDGLKKSIEELKIEITNLLADKCHLVGLSSYRGSKFLADIAHLIPHECSTLHEGFIVLANFELSYRGLIQHHIRENLDDLKQDNSPLPQGGKEQDILDNLDELYKETVYKCKNALDNNFLRIPSQAAFAIVEEFVDLVLRSKDAQRQWRKFLLPYRADIWTDTFQILGDNTRLRQQWIQLIEDTENINSSLL
ncbi:hypothetical protein VKI22_08795 [Cyanobacterium aponinum UTEX 3221]|uniref:hypothetical protein n=1 Tax=Cyanobacterium aponinum TaxID=379064 RepID=UPI002B4BBC3E|nr:hypothetical protein [Cyanobacterium aponinum]WRL40158.1 hypothetical protein VKI22_08795 [Cyanobacterium aponinum UTEX 3221]